MQYIYRFRGEIYKDMNLYHFIYFTVEFWKLYLFSTILLQIKVKKTIQSVYLICAFVITILTMFVDFTDYTGFYGLISVAIMMIYVQNNKKRWFFPVIYIGISVFDILISLILIPAMHITEEMIDNHLFIPIIVNSVFLILSIMVICYRKYKKKQPIVIETYRYMWLYFLAGITVVFYLSCIQMNKLRSEFNSYDNIMYWAIGLSGIVLLVICILFFIKNNENEILQKKEEVNERLLKTQMEYYQMLLEKEKQTKAFRHDINNHIFCMQNLLEEKKYDELDDYLRQINNKIVSLSSNINTGNTLISAIINDATDKFPGVSFKWKGILPEQLEISPYDSCTIFSNLIINAFEAADKADKKEVTMGVSKYKNTLVFHIENTYGQEPVIEKGQYISSKAEKGHGFGFQNAKTAIEKNGGIYQVSVAEKRFITEIILPNILNRANKDEWSSKEDEWRGERL